MSGGIAAFVSHVVLAAGPDGRAGATFMLLTVAVGVSVTAAIGYLASRLVRMDRLRHGPTCRRFARSLGLNWRQQRLVEKVARGAGLPGGVSMLVSRGCFDWAVKAFPLRPELSPAVAAIRRQVFDEGRE